MKNLSDRMKHYEACYSTMIPPRTYTVVRVDGKGFSKFTKKINKPFDDDFSESMQFASSLIHWGTITENDVIRDLGIYIYTTEQTAIEEYWFDMYERNFKPDQQYSLVSRVWGNSYDNGTFWTADIAASYGIEMYPIHGGSLYLGHNTAYVQKLWNEIKALIKHWLE